MQITKSKRYSMNEPLKADIWMRDLNPFLASQLHHPTKKRVGHNFLHMRMRSLLRLDWRENLRILINYFQACEKWRLCVQEVAKHLPERTILYWPLWKFNKVKFSMKSLTFSCLICALNLYSAQKLFRKTKNCSRLLEPQKVPQKLASTIGTWGLIALGEDPIPLFTFLKKVLIAMKKLFLSHRLSRMKCFLLWLDETLLVI